uniref:Uncharacterized protein n=1 Tax=Scylla olivacea TaxID=85551 RepID=A0A0P4WIG2_SCYOL
MEKMLIQRCLAGIPRDLDLLEQLVIEHKQFENDLSSRELEVESIQKNYQNLSRRTPAIQRTVESITQQWDRIWALSHVYIERCDFLFLCAWHVCYSRCVYGAVWHQIILFIDKYEYCLGVVVA